MSDRTQDLKNLRAVATACKNYVDETKEQILWQVGQYNITTQDDNTTAYQKTVPTGATRAKIKSIGGMSYKSENLVLEQKQINLSAGSDQWVNFIIYNLVVGETYTASIFTNSASNEVWQNQTYSYRTITKANPHTFTATATSVTIRVGANNLTNSVNYESKLMLVKGSTAPTTYQPYFTGLRDSAVTSIKSYDSNNNLIDTYTIPSEIQALEGYGWGVNSSVYNYIDYKNNKFVKKVNKKVLNGTEAWYKNDVWCTENNIAMFVNYTDSEKATTANYDSINTSNFVPAQYPNSATVDQIRTSGNVLYLNFTANGGKINEFTIEKAKEWLSNNNLTVYYELATPVETDISQYITDNVIEVEAGGYLVFENQYQQAVPSNITYRIEVAK